MFLFFYLLVYYPENPKVLVLVYFCVQETGHQEQIQSLQEQLEALKEITVSHCTVQLLTLTYDHAPTGHLIWLMLMLQLLRCLKHLDSKMSEI